MISCFLLLAAVSSTFRDNKPYLRCEIGRACCLEKCLKQPREAKKHEIIVEGQRLRKANIMEGNAFFLEKMSKKVWSLVAILTCTSFYTFRSACFTQGSWSWTALSGKANDWRNRQQDKGRWKSRERGREKERKRRRERKRERERENGGKREAPPCVHSTRLRVCVQNVPVCTGNMPTWKKRVGMLPVHTGTFWTHTRGRVECTHGGFQRATPQQTPPHTTHNTHPTRTHQHAHTTQTTPRERERGEEDRRGQKTEEKRTGDRRQKRRGQEKMKTREKIRRSRDEEKMKLNCLINCPSPKINYYNSVPQLSFSKNN